MGMKVSFISQTYKSIRNFAGRITHPNARTDSCFAELINVSKTKTDMYIPSGTSAIKETKTFLQNFLSGADESLERIFMTHDFAKYGKQGIPLKYPRAKFIEDINNLLKDLPESKQTELLNKFNLQKGAGDIDGITNLANVIPNSESQKLHQIIENFYHHNETTFANPDLKKTFDGIMKDLPEFNMAIGKMQHGTHAYSVDIHSLLVLQKAMQNPSYANLSEEGKKVLKLTTLLHDLGKKGNVITTGHAAISEQEAQIILGHNLLPRSINNRVLKHIREHHWFEKYNKGITSPRDVVKTFITSEDIEISKILAKADLESIGRGFHLEILNPRKILTQEEFNAEFAEKISKIHLFTPSTSNNARVKKTIESMLQQREKIQNPTRFYTVAKILTGIKEAIFLPNRAIRVAIANSKGQIDNMGKIIDTDGLLHTGFLDRVIAQTKIPRSTTLYRVSTPMDFGLPNVTTEDFIKRFYKKGKVFSIPIFPNTSLERNVAENFLYNDQRRLMFKINVPKGTNGVYMEKLGTDISDEQEVLLARNLLYKFKKHTSMSNHDIIEVDVIPKKPRFKTVHTFWKEMPKEYWDNAPKMPLFTEKSMF